MSPAETPRPPIVGPGRGTPLEVFHRLNRVIPENQELFTVPPDMKASEALALMAERGFSQLPVVVGKEVLGLFSYRSFAREVVRRKPERFVPGDLAVEDCLERPAFARVTDEFRTWFDQLDQADAILVGDPDRLQGIVTAMDVLRYLYGVASPFVLLAEIELALRALIRLAVNAETLGECARISLASRYEPDSLPTRLESMSFNDYIQLIGDGRCWSHFEPIFRGNRNSTRTKLEEVRDLRNDVFHFRRELTVADYEQLSDHRDWVLLKARVAQARREERT